MRLKSANFNYYSYVVIACSVALSFALGATKSSATSEVSRNKLIKSVFQTTEGNLNSRLDTASPENLIVSNLSPVPEAVDLVKNFEGFRSSAYTDTSGLPVIGYGQTRVNGKTVRLGQYITQEQANVALEQELYHLQQLVLAHVKVELNPYQLGALTSLVYNAGTSVITNSTLIKKLNAGDYAGAAREFPRWNKANQGGSLVVFPGLTRRRLAEKELFLTPYEEIASNK